MSFTGYLKEKKGAFFIRQYVEGMIDPVILREMLHLLGCYVIGYVIGRVSQLMGDALTFQPYIISPRLCFLAIYYNLSVDGEEYGIELMKVEIPYGAIGCSVEEVEEKVEKLISETITRYQKLEKFLERCGE